MQCHCPPWSVCVTALPGVSLPSLVCQCHCPPWCVTALPGVSVPSLVCQCHCPPWCVTALPGVSGSLPSLVCQCHCPPWCATALPGVSGSLPSLVCQCHCPPWCVSTTALPGVSVPLTTIHFLPCSSHTGGFVTGAAALPNFFAGAGFTSVALTTEEARSSGFLWVFMSFVTLRSPVGCVVLGVGGGV